MMADQINKNGGDARGASPSTARGEFERPALQIDYALYDHFLESADLSEDQRREFMDALWHIIVQFVDLGFGVHPLQQSGNAACEQNSELFNFLPSESADVVGLEDILKTDFDDTSDAQSIASVEKEE